MLNESVLWIMLERENVVPSRVYFAFSIIVYVMNQQELMEEDMGKNEEVLVGIVVLYCPIIAL